LRDGEPYPLVALVVLDGWGCAAPGPGNAVELAATPVFDAFWAGYPHTTLAASGRAVGLPEGQMGNSEVGHLTIGAGRVVPQDLVRVNDAIADGSFFENEALVGAFRRAQEQGGNVHLLGLVSYGGVHSHIDHLRALLELARRRGTEARTFVHAFTDGRDVSPHAAASDLAELVGEGTQIVTVVGRSERLLEAGVGLTTMTRYREDFDCPVAFAEHVVDQTLAEVLAAQGARQLHLAETEKYAHVTYFFNGGEEREWEGETRILVPSPRDVATYDLKPEMSAAEVARQFEERVGDGYRFAIVNFANPDMVGHTGVIPAVVRAVETVDACLGRLVAKVEELGGACLITADHGNAEQMLESDGTSPHTAHTTNPVPLVVTVAGASLREGGSLSDLVPTCLELLGIPAPDAMAGKTLLVG
jgi:bisphosphoglycerate-independent phosphoglycerate mutase (AlkP superfamily)